MSATASSFPHSHTLPREPFGQAGVRQYLGRILAWVLFTLALVAAAMAQRSGGFDSGSGYYDTVQYRGRGQGMGLISMNGQFVAFAGSTTNPNSNSGWTTGGGYIRDAQRFGRRRWGNASSPFVTWQSDVGRTLGFEYQSSVPGREFSEGILFRFRWMTLAVLFLLQPLVYVLMQLRRRRAEARGEA